MGRQTPQPHTHSGPGDGGRLESLEIVDLTVTGTATGVGGSGARGAYEYIMYLDGTDIRVQDATGSEVTSSPWDNSANEAHLAAQYMVNNASAESPGWIAPGDYNYGGRINMADNSALHGTRASKFVAQSQIDPFIKGENITNVELRGFQIDGNSVEQNVIQFNKNVVDIRVMGLKVGNTDPSLGNDMILFNLDPTPDPAGNNIQIVGNEVYHDGSSLNANQSFGISLREGSGNGVENVQILRNYCRDMDHNGICIYGDAKNVVCSHNLVENVGHTGISSSPSVGTIISNNTVRNVADNEQEGAAGIEVENDGAHTTGIAGRRVTVRNNVIENCPFGFAMFKRNDATAGDPDPREVILDGNIFRNINSNDQTRSPAAIELEAGKVQVRIGDNIYENCTQEISFRQGTDSNGQVADEMGSTIMDRSPAAALVDVGGAPTYTGDGTTGRNIDLGFTPSYVAVQGSDSTWYDVHREFGNGYQHTTPTGELSIVDGGFQVGDNAGDADPNTTGETYTVYYER